MSKNTRLLLAFGASIAVAPTLTVCATTQGAGEDLQVAGRGLSNSVSKNTPPGKKMR
jgi:predicted small secreted protein